MYFAPAAIEVLDVITPISLTRSIIALLGTSGLLLLWSLLPSRRLTHAHGVQVLDDYAEYFDLPESEIVAGRDSTICVVHHDDHGNLIGIVPRE
jgi:poly-beta-1,6-N-acetyl-D-glucosamine biosynthesis protein PgaD